MRSGQSRSSILWRYSSRRSAYSFHPRPSRLRALSEARCSASSPPISMCPSSVFGRRRPPMNTEVPIPVPSVSMSTTPSSSPAHLGQPCCVAVVDHTHRVAKFLLEPSLHVKAYGRLIDVGSGLYRPVFDHSREAAPHRSIPPRLPLHLHGGL